MEGVPPVNEVPVILNTANQIYNVLALSLPPIDGHYDVGIAATAEAGLVSSQKLKIPSDTHDPNQCIGIAVWEILANRGDMPDLHLKILISAAAVCVKFNLCRVIGLEKDGDFEMVNPTLYNQKEFSEADVSMIKEATTMDAIRDAATYIAATKVNWYKENHHTGQMRVSTYIAKVISARLGIPPDDRIVSIMHRIGHWASTREVLTQLGIRDIAPTTAAALITPAGHLQCAADMTIRIRSNPAGTARHFLAHALCKRLVNSVAVAYCPNWVSFANILPQIVRIRASPAVFHAGSGYLCRGTAAFTNRGDFNDQDADIYLGRAGTYGHVFMPSSTLMKSPHIMNRRFQNCDDYSPPFESALIALRKKQNRFRVVGTVFGSEGGQGMGDLYDQLTAGFGVAPNRITRELMVSGTVVDDHATQEEPFVIGEREVGEQRMEP